MKHWDIKPLKDTSYLLQYHNASVVAKDFDLLEFTKMDPSTPVYYLITSGKDGSYIADNFVARHELPKFEQWPYTYATIELVIQNFSIDIPMETIGKKHFLFVLFYFSPYR